MTIYDKYRVHKHRYNYMVHIVHHHVHHHVHHSSIFWDSCAGAPGFLDGESQERILSYLPLSHIAGMAVDITQWNAQGFFTLFPWNWPNKLGIFDAYLMPPWGQWWLPPWALIMNLGRRAPWIFHQTSCQIPVISCFCDQKFQQVSTLIQLTLISSYFNFLISSISSYSYISYISSWNFMCLHVSR